MVTIQLRLNIKARQDRSMETHCVTAVVGSNSPSRVKFCSTFAKKSESQGLEIYHRTGCTQSLLNPATYPEKIVHLAKAVTLSTFPVFLLPSDGTFDWSGAETAIALDSAGLSRGLIVSKRGLFGKEKINKLLGDTKLSGYKIVEVAEDRYEGVDLDSVIEPATRGYTVVSVDNVFTVKGVGLVALGFVMGGSVGVHDGLKATSGKTVEIRSLQVMDKDVEEAGAGTRVGMAIKGLTEKELEDETFLVKDCSFKSKFKARLVKNRFYKQDVMSSKSLHLSLFGQVVPCVIENLENGMALLNCARPIPDAAESALLINLNLNPGALRIAGTLELGDAQWLS
jgi:selenocysteine-specific translation elongation factor